MEGTAMSNQALLCLRTNKENQTELYALTEAGEFVFPCVISVEIGKIESGSLLTANFTAHIHKLG
jgi:uncharacterized protein YfcZ (UPF0381/DUF406 family)